jgi:hypothetical protein
MAIENIKSCMILALLIFNTAFWLYTANKQMAAMCAHPRRKINKILS